MCRTGAGSCTAPTVPGMPACACFVSRRPATGQAFFAPWKRRLFRVRVNLDHLIEEIAALIDRTDAQPLVEPVCAIAVGIAEHARYAIGGNARGCQEGAVGC